MQNINPAERQLIDAETKLARALQHLSALRRAALYGSYDATMFDQAVAGYRAAEREVLEARKAWAQRKGKPPDDGYGLADCGPEEEEIVPLKPTPRLLFARWLVQTGRLSDQNVGDSAEPAAEPALAAR